ncbi:MAG: winged helix-turn-helix transcriptional regulator [Clostridia bacterium]|nr:winged helix-turn-helix transcriptional regulator [Clostridia bacterium]
MINKEITLAIVELNKKIEKVRDQVVKKVGLSKIQALVLINIYNNNKNNIECSVKHIVEEFEANQGNTSSLLKRMESSGLIEKVRAKDDERKVNLVLTELGKNKILEMRAEVDKYKARMDAEYTNENKKVFIDNMKKLEELLDLVIEED